jgi:hypothetical protein
LSQDPIMAGHPYVYVRNNPVRFVDPLGLFCAVFLSTLEEWVPCDLWSVVSAVDFGSISFAAHAKVAVVGLGEFNFLDLVFADTLFVVEVFALFGYGEATVALRVDTPPLCTLAVGCIESWHLENYEAAYRTNQKHQAAVQVSVSLSSRILPFAATVTVTFMGTNSRCLADTRVDYGSLLTTILVKSITATGTTKGCTAL